MKTVISVIAIIVSCCINFTFAQINPTLKGFQKSVTSVLLDNYKTQDTCFATSMLLRAVIESNKVIDLQISDSADSLLLKEFGNIKRLIDTSYLINLSRRSQSSRYTIYLIPIFLNTIQYSCSKSRFITSSFLKINKFKGVEFKGQAVMLPIINGTLDKPVK